MTGNLFPAKGNLFHVTGNEFPVTRRTKNTLCHRNNISLRWKYTSCDRLDSLYSCHRNPDILDISCNKKISSCQKNNFSIDCQNNWLNDSWYYKIIEIFYTTYWMESLKNFLMVSNLLCLMVINIHYSQGTL